MTFPKDDLTPLISAEIKEFYGITVPENTEEEEIVYPLSTFLWGIFRTKLQVHFLYGKAVNYRTCMYCFKFRFRQIF